MIHSSSLQEDIQETEPLVLPSPVSLPPSSVKKQRLPWCRFRCFIPCLAIAVLALLSCMYVDKEAVADLGKRSRSFIRKGENNTLLSTGFTAEQSADSTVVKAKTNIVIASPQSPSSNLDNSQNEFYDPEQMGSGSEVSSSEESVSVLESDEVESVQDKNQNTNEVEEDFTSTKVKAKPRMAKLTTAPTTMTQARMTSLWRWRHTRSILCFI
jgi:hypothetical protein